MSTAEKANDDNTFASKSYRNCSAQSIQGGGASSSIDDHELKQLKLLNSISPPALLCYTHALESIRIQPSSHEFQSPRAACPGNSLAPNNTRVLERERESEMHVIYICTLIYM